MVAPPKMPPVFRMMAAEFTDWAQDTPGRWQLMDGEPVAVAAASDTHGSIQAGMAGLIGNLLRGRGLPCRVVVAPGVVPRPRATQNVRVPDLAVTCQPPSLQRRLTGQPALAVEILSLSDEAGTWRNMWSHASIPSMQDILVVRSLEIGSRPDGTWAENAAPISGCLRLPSIDATSDVAAFHATAGLARPAAS